MVLWILLAVIRLRVRGFHPLWQAFPKPFYCLFTYTLQSEPQNARILVWALPLSLAATNGIDVSFSSSGYLDVSVHRVPSITLCIHVNVIRLLVPGFPIQKSMDHGIFAPPHRLSQLITSFVGSQCQGIRPVLFVA